MARAGAVTLLTLAEPLGRYWMGERLLRAER